MIKLSSAFSDETEYSLKIDIHYTTQVHHVTDGKSVTTVHTYTRIMRFNQWPSVLLETRHLFWGYWRGKVPAPKFCTCCLITDLFLGSVFEPRSVFQHASTENEGLIYQNDGKGAATHAVPLAGGLRQWRLHLPGSYS